MAKRTVYARYSDKEALFKAALSRAIDDWLVPVERLRAAETQDLEQTLIAIARMLLANILSAAGLRLLRLSNAVSVSMPEIAAFNTRMGTEPTLTYLADLFRRRLFAADVPADGAGEVDEASEAGEPAEDEASEAALAFLHLVGGPASTAAWGVALDEGAADRHTRYCVRLFLHGSLTAGRAGAADAETRQLEATRQLRATLDRAAALLDEARESLRDGEHRLPGR